MLRCVVGRGAVSVAGGCYQEEEVPTGRGAQRCALVARLLCWDERNGGRLGPRGRELRRARLRALLPRMDASKTAPSVLHVAAHALHVCLGLTAVLQACRGRRLSIKLCRRFGVRALMTNLHTRGLL